MDQKRVEIYIAALLKDIGIFLYRSLGVQGAKRDNNLVAEFINDNFSQFEIAKESLEDIIAEVTCNLRDSYFSITDQINHSPMSFLNDNTSGKLLASVFPSIYIGADLNKLGLHYYSPLYIDKDNIFPEFDASIRNFDNWNIDGITSRTVHKEQLDLLKNDLRKIRSVKSLDSLAYTLYFILNKYTSRVLYDKHQDSHDVSLFDQLKTEAGLINCLSLLLSKDKISSYKSSLIPDDFVLFKGDISGIQKFIYSDIDLNKTGQSKGLAKRLRGRSFYISLLTDFFANLFLREFDLAEANILYSGGGHFTLVLPNIPGCKSKIDKINGEINRFLREDVSLSLSLVVGYKACNSSLYTETNEMLNKVSYELTKNKHKIHEDYLEDVFYQSAPNKQYQEDEKIGRLIPYAGYLIEVEPKEGITFKDDKLLVAAFKKFNRYFFALRNPGSLSENKYDLLFGFFNPIKDKIKSAKVIRLNDTDFLEHASALLQDFGFPIAFSYKFLGQQAPKNDYGELLEFSEIAGVNYQAKQNDLSFSQLAVMRLDVDNLGNIFGFGLGEKVAFPRISILSRYFDHFFAGYFNTLAEKYCLYITYSGGDDAFLIGSWFNILHFSKELYEKFKEFTCNNPNLTFSAGIFICNENYPIAKMAKEAGEMESISKNFTNRDGKKKNSITVFDHTLNWDRYCSMLTFGERLLQYTSEDGIRDKEKLARSLIHRLLRIIKSCLDENGHVNTRLIYRNVAQLHYLFARHGFTNDKIEKAQDGLAKDIIALLLNDFSKPELIKDYLIPTNYVVLKTRKLNI